MKRLLNKNSFIGILALVAANALIFYSCNKNELRIQQDYPFEVSVMPVPRDAANGQTIEIRMAIQRRGDFRDAAYFIRYFQYDGKGTLRYYNDAPYRPNDLYPLSQTQFRLYYTSRSTVSQSFDIWISDNFGNEKQMSFEFNSSDKD